MECQKRFGALGVGFACLYRKRVLVFVALLTIYIFYSCKLWWKVHTGDGLWSRYVNSITVSRSFAASRLADVDDLMRQHTTYLVRSGSSYFLHSNWSGLGFLRDLFPSLLASLDTHRLCDLLVDGFWRDDLLPPAVLLVVSSFCFSFSTFPDTWIWKPEPSGSFSISSVYSVIRTHHSPVPHFAWVWSRHLPVKVSIFF